MSATTRHQRRAAGVPLQRQSATPRKRGARKRLTGLVLTAPALAALVVTILFPLAWTVWLSFHSFGLGPAATQRFVGLANYTRILASSEFLSALAQTLGYVAVTLVIELVIGLALAHMLRRTRWTTKLLRLVIALPLMIAPVVASMAFRFLFANNYGLINHGLSLLGLPEPAWLGSPWFARGSVLLTNLWLAVPFVVLVLLAGMVAIPGELDESARTDGANSWQIFFRITLPLLKPSILIVLIIRLADAFRVFDSVYVLTGGGPANSTDVMSTYLFRTLFTRSDFAGGSAVTVLFVIVVGVIAGALFFILRDRKGPQ